MNKKVYHKDFLAPYLATQKSYLQRGSPHMTMIYDKFYFAVLKEDSSWRSKLTTVKFSVNADSMTKIVKGLFDMVSIPTVIKTRIVQLLELL